MNVKRTGSRGAAARAGVATMLSSVSAPGLEATARAGAHRRHEKRLDKDPWASG